MGGTLVVLSIARVLKEPVHGDEWNRQASERDSLGMYGSISSRAVGLIEWDQGASREQQWVEEMRRQMAHHEVDKVGAISKGDG